MVTFFRAGVGIIVCDDAGAVAVFERGEPVGSWQYPQGGIEAGESPLDAAWRELREETALTSHDVVLVAELDDWLAYELPPEARSAKTGMGQAQRWFLFRAHRLPLPVQLEHAGELRSWKWSNVDEVADRAVSFRRPTYRRLAVWVRQALSPGPG